jgi:excisionase family DNA binding protein
MEKAPSPTFPITVTVDRFCELSGISRSHCYQLIKLGRIESVCVGKRRLIVMDSFRRLIAAAPTDEPKPVRPGHRHLRRASNERETA